MSYIYLLAAIFFAASQILFYSRILYFGVEIEGALAIITKLLLIIIPVYLYFNLPRLKKAAFYLALFFQAFLILNSLLMIMEKYSIGVHPIFRVAGIFGPLEYSAKQMMVILLNFILNFVMLGVIINQRKLFLPKANGK